MGVKRTTPKNVIWAVYHRAKQSREQQLQRNARKLDSHAHHADGGR
jgi:hypothetical protein